MTVWTYDFTDPLPVTGEAVKHLLGGKGASLALMSQAGLRVPPGFTITTEACAAFFAAGRRWPAGLEAEVRTRMTALEARSGRRFGRGAEPLLVSVRSGAAASMPGMMDTILNCGLSPALADEVGDQPSYWSVYLQFVRSFAKTVHHLPEADLGHHPATRAGADACLAAYRTVTGQDFPTDPLSALSAAIEAVFNSWNNDRAIAYRQKHDIRGLTGTAVNIQVMWPSQVSGVLFTQDPNDASAERIVIEANYGLGESVVSGDVTPDKFVQSRRDGSITRTVGRKSSAVAAFGRQVAFDPDAPALDDAQVRELCELGLAVERYYGKPVDIEWGVVDGVFALLQSRVIRGYEVQADIEPGRLAEIERLRSLAVDAAGAPRHKVWVAHNLGETLRAPTPLTWDLIRRFMSGEGGFGRLYRLLGYHPSALVSREGFLELICGRIYADPDRLAQMFWYGPPLPTGYDLAVAAKDRKALDGPPTTIMPERADGAFLFGIPLTLARMLRARRAHARLRASVRADSERKPAPAGRATPRFEQDILPAWKAWVATERARDLTGLSDDAVVDVLESRAAKVLDDFAADSLLPGFFGGLALDSLSGTLTTLLGPNQGPRLAHTLCMALPGDTTFEQDALLHRVAGGLATMDEFLTGFGHRATGEMELMEPRWREDRTFLDTACAQMRVGGRDPERIHHDNAAQRDTAEAGLAALLALHAGSCLEADVRADLAEARALLPYREAGKHYLMMGYETIRLAIMELARRWDIGNEIFFLHRDELRGFAPRAATLLAEAARRKTRWQSAQRLDLADTIDSDQLAELGRMQIAAGASEYKGDSIASGLGSGPARIVFDPKQAGELGRDYILVCPSTDPGWTPLFMNCRGVVVERGGVLSHGAIVARDFGIPAVCLPGATRLIKPGSRLRVDGNAGRVVIEEDLA